jgi:hypothetical protein
MAQEGGGLSQQEIERWMNQMDAEKRGEAMYHLYDAAQKQGIAGGIKLESVQVGIQAGPLRVQAGFSYSDTYWERTVGDIEMNVNTETGKYDPNDKEGQQKAQKEIENYNKGLEESNKHVPHVHAAS